MDDQVTPEQFLIFLFALAAGGVLACIYWYWQFGTGPVAWARAIVKYFRERARKAPHVMSRSEASAPPSVPSSLQTDNRQTADSAARALPSRDVMLDTYKLLRKHGMTREEARPMLKALGLPLDNNLWTDAAPPSKDDDDDVLVTPYAGRRTKASYYDDPRLEYQAPPR